ncbi:MAG TPA: STAS domain-containing protein [Streptosporangiaceae bacterium]
MADQNPPGTAPVTVQTSREGSTPVVAIAGELDLSNADAVRSAIEDELHPGTPKLVFELSELQFMDSSGIALLASLAQRVPEVELRHPTDIVRRILEITGVDQWLPMTS